MATLHIFNASHDEALAAHSPYYYPSTIARTLECRWAALPAVWTSEDDFVLLPKPTKGQPPCPDNLPDVLTASLAPTAAGKLPTFIFPSELTPKVWRAVSRIEPWGWDLLVRHKLLKCGAPEALFPTAEQIDAVRTLSSRATTSRLLPALREDLLAESIGTVGVSRIASSEEEVDRFLEEYPEAMGKSLWSCSGRGVFPLSRPLNASTLGRVRRLLAEQGGVELEPRYEPVLDFALEFFADRAKGVRYEGLSLFSTNSSGGYTQNILEPQSRLAGRLTALWGSPAAFNTLVRVCSEQLALLLGSKYEGYLGIDMMLAKQQGGSAQLHPCIEVNLRRTMGIAALAAAQDDRRKNLFKRIMGK